MIINAVIFGLVAGLVIVGLKHLWKSGPVMRGIVSILAAPIVIFVFLVIWKMITV